VIDQEVSRLLSEAEDRARTLLSDNRPALDAVVAALLEKETISGEELAETVNRTQAASDGQGTEKPSPADSPSATR
jgi:cell division protease FtsH